MNSDLAKSWRAQTADFYETYGASFDETRQFVWPEERLIAEQVRPEMTVIDVGAGNGRFARLLPENTHYIGFEPAASLRNCAPQLDLRPGSLPSIPCEDATADITVCFAVFHHLVTQEERIASFKELLRLTKPGGLIAFTSWYGLNHPHAEAIRDGQPGDTWIPWKKDGTSTNRFVHTLNAGEIDEITTDPTFILEKAGLFGKETWTEKTSEARNWFVMGRRKEDGPSLR